MVSPIYLILDVSIVLDTFKIRQIFDIFFERREYYGREKVVFSHHSSFRKSPRKGSEKRKTDV
jgi:hypothetical protein